MRGHVWLSSIISQSLNFSIIANFLKIWDICSGIKSRSDSTLLRALKKSNISPDSFSFTTLLSSIFFFVVMSSVACTTASSSFVFLLMVRISFFLLRFSGVILFLFSRRGDLTDTPGVMSSSMISSGKAVDDRGVGILRMFFCNSILIWLDSFSKLARRICRWIFGAIQPPVDEDDTEDVDDDDEDDATAAAVVVVVDNVDNDDIDEVEDEEIDNDNDIEADASVVDDDDDDDEDDDGDNEEDDATDKDEDEDDSDDGDDNKDGDEDDNDDEIEETEGKEDVEEVDDCEVDDGNVTDGDDDVSKFSEITAFVNATNPPIAMSSFSTMCKMNEKIKI